MIFLVGPGGVGKSTIGPYLAEELCCDFYDLDTYFCNNIDNIGVFIRDEGYDAYVKANSKGFFELLEQANERSVFALSSGFLIYESEETSSVVNANREAVRSLGVSVLIAPNADDEVSGRIVVDRQLNRGFGLKRHKEWPKFRNRIEIYRTLADVVFFANSDDPALNAKEIALQLDFRPAELVRKAKV